MLNQPEIVAHSHKCPNGHELRHREDGAGGQAVHTCPQCGEILPQLVYADPKGNLTSGWEKANLFLTDGRVIAAKRIHAPRWRVYKLPGSGPWFNIDSGPLTPVIYARKIEGNLKLSADFPGKMPHKWFEAEGQIAVSNDGVVRFL